MTDFLSLNCPVACMAYQLTHDKSCSEVCDIVTSCGHRVKTYRAKWCEKCRKWLCPPCHYEHQTQKECPKETRDGR